jgi:sugar phosphate isomerase/epimerase
MEVGIMLFIGCAYATLDEQIAVLKELGVKRTFLSGGHPRLEEAMNKIAEAGIVCDNYHANVNGEKNGISFKVTDLHNEGEAGDLMLERLFENIINCAKYNVPVLVVHGPGGKSDEEWPPILIERMNKLMDFAKQNGITIAFENLSNATNVHKIFGYLPEASFCWDCGHQYCNTPDTRFLQYHGDRLVALHIHDNNCVHREDLHVLPYDGKIDFDEVAMDLASCGYDGTMMLEIMYDKIGKAGGGYAERMSYLEYATRARDAAQRIIDRVEYFKGQQA